MMRVAGRMYMYAMSQRGAPRREPAGAAVAASVIAKLAISLLVSVRGSASRRSAAVASGYVLFALFVAAPAWLMPPYGVVFHSMYFVVAWPIEELSFECSNLTGRAQ